MGGGRCLWHFDVALLMEHAAFDAKQVSSPGAFETGTGFSASHSPRSPCWHCAAREVRVCMGTAP